MSAPTTQEWTHPEDRAWADRGESAGGRRGGTEGGADRGEGGDGRRGRGGGDATTMSGRGTRGWTRPEDRAWGGRVRSRRATRPRGTADVRQGMLVQAQQA